MAVGVSDFPVRKEWVGKKESASDGRWWKRRKDEVHEGIVPVVNSIDENSSMHDADLEKWARLYGNRDLLGSGIGRNQKTAPTRNTRAGRLAFNVVGSCVDTAAAKIAKSKPRPLFLTIEGDGSLQRRAKWLTKYIEGVFYDAKVYHHAQRAFIDACVFGTGIIKLFWEETKHGPQLRVERILPSELLVDEQDGRYADPRQLFQRKWINVDVLCDLFPNKEAEIRARATRESSKHSTRAPGEVQVIEAWHLPSGPNAKDGRHAICIDGCTLLSEDWDADYFPFCVFRWKDPLTGYWGTGLAEELVEIQLAINRTARAIQQAQHLVSQPRVFVEAGSQVVSAHLNNAEGGIVKYVGKPPVFQTPTAMQAEAYRWLNDLIDKAYAITGISQLSAQAVKPAGLNSGVALREFNDSANERFSLTGQRWEEMFMDLARKAVDMTRRLHMSGEKKLSVKTRIGKFTREIKWKDVDLEEDKYQMQVFPTSILPTTPAGKLQTVQELAQAGFIAKSQALSLLDFPDLEDFMSLQTAAIDDIKWTIDKILEDGEPQDVDELTDLEMAITLGMQAVMRAKRRGDSEENIELLRRWIDACKDKLSPPMDEAANDNGAPPPAAGPGAPPAGGPGGPMARPAPLPQSDLMPVSDERAKEGVAPLTQDQSQMRDGPSDMRVYNMEKSFHRDTPQDQARVKRAVEDRALKSAQSMMAGYDMHLAQGPSVHVPDQTAEPAQFMDAIGPGKSFHYKDSVPGEDPNERKFGTTTQDLKRTEMGQTMVKRDPRTGYEAIDIKDSIGPMLASLGNLNQRLRQLEGYTPANDNAATPGLVTSDNEAKLKEAYLSGRQHQMNLTNGWSVVTPEGSKEEKFFKETLKENPMLYAEATKRMQPAPAVPVAPVPVTPQHTQPVPVAAPVVAPHPAAPNAPPPAAPASPSVIDKLSSAAMPVVAGPIASIANVVKKQ